MVLTFLGSSLRIGSSENGLYDSVSKFILGITFKFLLVNLKVGFWITDRAGVVLLESFAGYLGLALVFVWGSALPGGLIYVFQVFLAIIGGIFILGGELGTRLSFYEVLRLS